jgi:O-antigen ligase
MKQVDLEWGRTNYLAGIIIISLPVTLGLIGSARGIFERLAWSGVLVANAVGLVLSTSKGAMVSLAMAFALSYAIGRGSSRVPRFILLAIVGATAALYSAGPLQEVLNYRLQASALDYSVSERLTLYQLGWDSFLRHPLLGLGPDNFEVASSHLHGLDTVPHNFELGYLAEGGIPGFVLAMLWVIAMGFTAWKARRLAPTARDRSLAVGLWAVFVGFVVHNQMESTIYGPQYKIVLMVWAAVTWALSVEWEGSARGANPEPTAAQ